MIPPDVQIVKLSKNHNLSSFDCGDDDINSFLKEDALSSQDSHIASTIILMKVMKAQKIIGFFSVAADALRLRGGERQEHELDSKQIPEFPAVKIARLGRDKSFKGKKIGDLLIETA